jgi:hypothetical protein
MPGDPVISISDDTQINIINQPNAGLNGSIDNCSAIVLTEADLFTALNGTPDVGGSWSPAISAGSRDYTYTVNATSPCVGTATAIVSVTEFATPSITGTTPGSSCGTGDVTLSATASIGTISWFANSSGGSTLHTGASYTISALASTTTYYVEAQNGICVSSRLPVIASIHPAVSVNAGSHPNICQGEEITLTATSLPAATYSYAWNVQGDANVIGVNQSLTITPVGDSNVNTTVVYEVIATDLATACSSTSAVSVVVESSPTTTVTSTNPVCPVLTSGSITFSFPNHPNRTGIEFSTSGVGGTYTNVKDNTGSYTATGLSSGDYDVWVRWGNNECPVDLGIVNLGLDNIPDASFNYAEPSYCSNESDPSPSITTAGGAFSSTAGLSINSTSGAIDLSASSVGSYVVTYTIVGDCGNIFTQNVTINTSPIPIGIFFD